MKRSWLIWFGFTLCFGIVLAAMAWISLTAVRLDQAEAAARAEEAEARRLEAEALLKEAEARRQAALEGKIRLALLWADLTLAPLINQENVRPWFAYRAFFPADQGYSRMLNENGGSQRLVPSPLLTATLPPNVLAYFQFEPDGRITSPQVPGGECLALAVPRHTTVETVQKARERLDEVKRLVDRRHLLAMLPERPAAPVQVVLSPGPASSNMPVPSNTPIQQQAGPRQGAEFPQQAIPQQAEQTLNSASPLAQSPQQRAAVKNRRMEMQQKGGQAAVDYDVRQELVLQGANNFQAEANVYPAYFNGGTLPSTDISGVPMTPLWLQGHLVLARRVAVGGQEYVQGCLLDWPSVKAALRDVIADLLPDADFEPVAAPSRDEARMLVALPVRLFAGTPASDSWRGQAAELAAAAAGASSDAPGALSPMCVSLAVAWACVLLAAGAVAGLLAGVMRLSARRASFVSAVTHELRTPLTTFQMYAEMLAEGMVPDGQRQRQYLATLRAEAIRLTHLVENVLSYARLERGRIDGRRESLSLGELIQRVEGRLAGRAEQAGMELAVEGDEASRATMISANVSAVEQILFNLVDNACKYAAEGSPPRIELSVAAGQGVAEVRVRDHGPGISPGVRRRLFRPFSKSAREAAHTAPGVGLGLALSRRLARDMRGELRLEQDCPPGTCFVLRLPAA